MNNSFFKKILMPEFLFIMFLLFSDSAFADVTPEQAREVRHLLDFVRDSGCVINRNGSSHPALEAVAHIEKKYDYFRDKINTTEDFIEYAASKSTISGNYYTVSCAGEATIHSSDWLLVELKKFRLENNQER